MGQIFIHYLLSTNIMENGNITGQWHISSFRMDNFLRSPEGGKELRTIGPRILMNYVSLSYSPFKVLKLSLFANVTCLSCTRDGRAANTKLR
jgi:hypothetical protein